MVGHSAESDLLNVGTKRNSSLERPKCLDVRKSSKLIRNASKYVAEGFVDP